MTSVPTTAASDTSQALGFYASRVDQHMAEVVEQEVADPWMRKAFGYHLGWLDERFESPSTEVRSGGKKARATLALLAYRAAAPTSEGDAPYRDDPDDVDAAMPLAAAIELLHNWSLVHDDIMDGDRTRRGRPALWTVCGQAQAINLGDCMHALAFRSLARLDSHTVAGSLVAELMSEMARATVDLTVGQTRDLAYETAPAADRGGYFEMIECKTAALISYATYSGALLGTGGDRAVAHDFGEFGRELGLSFQIRDDILGIWGTDAETGKPTGTDIRRRKKTLPVVLALESAGTQDGERLHRLYAQRSPLMPADERYVRETLDQCGAQELAQDWADRHRVRAVAALASRPNSSAAGAALRALADFVTDRTH